LPTRVAFSDVVLQTDDRYGLLQLHTPCPRPACESVPARVNFYRAPAGAEVTSSTAFQSAWPPAPSPVRIV